MILDLVLICIAKGWLILQTPMILPDPLRANIVENKSNSIFISSFIDTGRVQIHKIFPNIYLTWPTPWSLTTWLSLWQQEPWDWPSSPGIFMMTSSYGNIFRVTGPLCGEFTGHRWIPPTNASDAELYCFINKPLRKNREAGDLRRHRGYYDVTVISCLSTRRVKLA